MSSENHCDCPECRATREVARRARHLRPWDYATPGEVTGPYEPREPCRSCGSYLCTSPASCAYER